VGPAGDPFDPRGAGGFSWPFETLGDNRAMVAESQEPAISPLILLVDDHEDSLDFLGRFLRFSGFRTAQARDGLEAIEKADELLPTLVLMDLMMPRMDGLKAARALKENPKTVHIPVVFLTAQTEYLDVGALQLVGCPTVLKKPIDPSSLLATIRKTLASAPPAAC
jgi:two-component system, cell cycle response regulator DivK